MVANEYNTEGTAQGRNLFGRSTYSSKIKIRGNKALARINYFNESLSTEEVTTVELHGSVIISSG
jgi:hypothetical protein